MGTVEFMHTSLTSNPAAVDAAVKAWRESAGHYTLANIHQGPGEGNYDRVERLRIEDVIRAAEGVGLDEQDTLVMQVVDEERKPMNRYEALRHAITAHGATTDWCGNLYIFHPMEVARRLDHPEHTEASTEDAVVVALLHDVLEDTDYELDAKWFSEEQWTALNLVTHTPELTYREYIERIATSGSRVAIMVKLADLSHNMSDERKENLSPDKLAQAERMSEERYAPARDRLWKALGTEWWPA